MHHKTSKLLLLFWATFHDHNVTLLVQHDKTSKKELLSICFQFELLSCAANVTEPATQVAMEKNAPHTKLNKSTGGFTMKFFFKL